MNFNISHQPEYDLNTSLIEESINLYGIGIKFLVVEKINKDDMTFGDWSHLKSDSEKIYDLMALPETSEEYDTMGMNFGQFGMLNMESINLFVARKSMNVVYEDIDSMNGFSSVVGNLIVLPNNRIMEITDFQFEVPGVNNMFTGTDRKSVYKLSCKTYDNKLINELPREHIASSENIDITGDYATLDSYFSELADKEEAVDTYVEVIPDVLTGKTIINNEEDSVFGKF